MKVFVIALLFMFGTTACQEFAKDAGETTKKTAKAVGDAVNSAAQAVEDAIERNKE